MTYLLAKYALLFVLAAVLGFILGYWFSRRNIEDVSETFDDLRKANSRSDEAHWTRLWGQLDAIPKQKDPDLSKVYDRLDLVAAAVSQIPKPEPLDLQPVVNELRKLEEDVKAIPAPEKPVPVDFSPLTGKVEALQAAVRSIPRPEPQRDVDLEPIEIELKSLRRELQGIPAVETHAPVDLTPVSARIDSLQQRVSAIPEPRAVDLTPLEERMKVIEIELGKLRRSLDSRTLEVPEARRESRDQPRILSAALYGKKDNLKMISGIGPKLEGLLNENGVYYFWQVAEWRDNDIKIMDQRLDAFKGRIERDNWVTQAGQLRNNPDAARMPAEF